MKIQLNQKFKKILNIVLGIVVIIFVILLLASIIFQLYLNPSEMFGLFYGALMCGSGYFMYKFSKTLRDKQRVAWSSYTELNRVFWGLSVASFYLSLLVIINIIDYVFDLRLYGISGNIIFDFIFSAIFSWVTFLAVANASKYTTILTRGFFITQILLYSLLYFFNIDKMDYIYRYETWLSILFWAVVIQYV